MQEQHKDLLAVLGAIAADELNEAFSALGHLSEPDVKDLALLVALLPRVDMDAFLYQLNDLTTLQQAAKKTKIRSEDELWYPKG